MRKPSKEDIRRVMAYWQSKRTDRQREQSRINGRKGGRPRKNQNFPEASLDNLEKIVKSLETGAK